MRSYTDLYKHCNYISQLTADIRLTVDHVAQDTCYICGSSSSKEVVLIHGYTYVECTNCGHSYTTSRPSAQSLAEFYSSNSYWSQTTYANKKTYQSRLEQIARPKFNFALQDLNSKSSTQRWLDIGCGIGDLLYIARDHGFDTCGLELSESSRDFALKEFQLTLLPYDLKDYISNYPDSPQFTVVSLIGLLEHVPNPVDILKSSISLLEDDGLVMIQVPNWDSFTTKLQISNPELVYRHASPLEHIQLFTIDSLKYLLSLVDLEICSIWWHGLDIHQLQVQYTLLSPSFADSSANELLTNMFNSLQQNIDDNRQSDRILITARKI